MKKCSKCDIEKEITEFYKGRVECKGCYKEIKKIYYESNKERKRAYMKIYRESNKEVLKERRKSYYNANKQAISERSKVYNEINKQAISDTKRVYYNANKDKARAYDEANKPKRNERLRNRRKTNELYALSSRLRCRTKDAFRLGGYSKDTKTEETLGCSWATLKVHIEKQFTDTMCWSKPESFHIDHIRPLANAKTKEELIERCHYKNLQPLHPEINLMKSNLTPLEWELKKQTKEYKKLITDIKNKHND